MREEYVNWMYNMVCSSNYYTKSYKKLFTFLDSITFQYENVLDENRAEDGIDFRYEFGNSNDIPNRIIKKELDNGPCSLLEMLVALSYRVEKTIMEDVSLGDRTGQWFWTMITNLNLGVMDDDNFDFEKVLDIVVRLQSKNYKRNGEGGLLTISDPNKDMRKVDIWCQMMWYLSENYDFSL